MENKEFNLSEKIFDFESFDEEGKELHLPMINKFDVKEFIKKETELLRLYKSGKCTWNFMIAERLKLVGKSLI